MVKRMTNVTFRIQEESLLKARSKALKEHRSLNNLINHWIKNYVGVADRDFNLHEYVKQFKNIKIGQKFTREERNAR